MAAQSKSVTSEYSCDLSKYGSGIPPVKLSATLEFPGTVTVGSPLNITLNTARATLPSAVLSQLNGVTSVDLAATVTAQHASATSVPLSGQAQVSGQVTGLPAGRASGSVRFLSLGTGVIDVPAPILTFTPHTSSATLKAITCTTTAPTRHVSVSVTLPVLGNSGPVYKCVISVGSVSGTALAHIPITITSSGSRSTGHTLTVTLSSPNTGLGGPYPGVKSVSFAGSLPVRGAQSGNVTLARTTTDVTNATFRVSGTLRLTKSGTDQLLIPDNFTFTLHGPAGTPPVVLTCTIDTSPTPVGLTFEVTQASTQPHPTASPTGTNGGGQGGSDTDGSGAPAGAPDTGGGTGQGSDLTLAMAGVAAVVIGGGLVLLARQRRRQGAGRQGAG